MNSPDSYVKYSPGDFAIAMAGQSPQIKWAYWACIVHYRCHNHCKGLENNDKYLRRLCEVETDEDWLTAKGLIFDNDKCFTLDENGLWQQIRAQLDYLDDRKRLEKWQKRGRAGANGRWKKK